ncbi:MAG: CopD family protein [Anaerolineae bacterium]|nr:CopD family protein [Anaerolineae bacterium]
MPTPEWVLLLSFWLHMLATVVWIGALASLSLVVLPAAKRSLDAAGYSQFMDAFTRRLDPLGWLCLALLTTTGLVQMSANPNYEGFLSISNHWARAILIKHMLFFAMIATSAYLTWGLAPALNRSALLRARGLPTPQEELLRQREAKLIQLNLALGVVTLLLTALARIT